MAVFTYNALRSITPGHVEGNSYDLEYRASVSRERRSEKNQQRARSGATETVYTRADVVYSIQTALIDRGARDIWYEFLDSVEGGEPFQFDETGTIAVPVNVLSVEMDSAGYTESPVDSLYVRFGFSIRVR